MAHETLCSFLEGLDYAVTRSAYGRPTAFEALSGSGGRLVNLMPSMTASQGLVTRVATTSLPLAPWQLF